MWCRWHEVRALKPSDGRRKKKRQKYWYFSHSQPDVIWLDVMLTAYTYSVPYYVQTLCYYYYFKAMAPHSSTLAWKIPWAEEPGRLQSMGSLRVGHDWANSLSLFAFMHWRRQWQPTPMFLPGESQGWGSLVGCPLWGRTESDMTEVT